MKASPLTFSGTLRLIKSDVVARIRYAGGRPGFWSGIRELLAPASLALAIWRFQALIHCKHIPLANKFLGLLNLVLFAFEVEPGAEIGEGFVLLNPVGIMLHAHTKIGRGGVFAHQITTSLGPRIGLDVVNDYIVLGDHVVVSAGVRIIGNLVIGDNTWVGPNTVVTESLPAESIVLGKTIHPRADLICHEA
jgi:serine O-acetyltransferase